MWIATAAECREMDLQAEAMGISVESLMHEAGRAVAACVIENYPDAKSIAVVCGKGNNGGDGLVAARLLAERQIRVEVLIAAKAEDLNTHAGRECARLKEVGIDPHFWPPTSRPVFDVDLVIDAVLGTGATGSPAGAALRGIEAILAADRPVVSIDIPSGVICDTGDAPGVAVRADRTVTFGLPKPFLFQESGQQFAGIWSVEPIGFPKEILDKPRRARLYTPNEAKSCMPIRAANAHKGTEGSVLVLAGNSTMPGAAVLCAYAALRAGAGLVTVASVQSVCETVSVHLPEAILLPLPEINGRLTKAAADELLPQVKRYDAAVVGPGLSSFPEVKAFLAAFFARSAIPLVIDADALNLVSQGVELPGGSAILTPHPGEAGRLLEVDGATIQTDRFTAVRSLFEKTGKTVVLKGMYTLIAEAEHALIVNPSGNPGMAVPGMGDVLSGVVGALLAKGLAPLEAAALGAYWHGLAGDLCAHEIGPAGFFASEVADLLPRTRATIAST